MESTEKAWKQGIKSDNIRSLFRKEYGCDISLIGYSRTPDGRWWSEYYVPFMSEELDKKYQRHIAEEIPEAGVIIVVRNYHLSDSEMKRRVEGERHQVEILNAREFIPQREMKEEYKQRVVRTYKKKEETEAERQRRLARQRAYYERIKADPARHEALKTKQREYKRMRNGTRPDLPYQTAHLSRENREAHLREQLSVQELPHEEETFEETRLAELMRKDDEGTLSIQEQLELETLIEMQEKENSVFS